MLVPRAAPAHGSHGMLLPTPTSAHADTPSLRDQPLRKPPRQLQYILVPLLSSHCTAPNTAGRSGWCPVAASRAPAPTAKPLSDWGRHVTLHPNTADCTSSVPASNSAFASAAALSPCCLWPSATAARLTPSVARAFPPTPARSQAAGLPAAHNPQLLSWLASHRLLLRRHFRRVPRPPPRLQASTPLLPQPSLILPAARAAPCRRRLPARPPPLR